MRFKREIVDVWEAQERIASRIRVLETEQCPLADCIGRYLGEDIVATHDVPHFRRSGMDGFAIRAADTVGASYEHPVKLRVIETVGCGDVPAKNVMPGTATRIMTGAMVPEGADAVVMFEMTDAVEKNKQDTISVYEELNSGDHISPIGMEITQGTSILEKGRRINPGEAALLAAFGCAEVTVYRRPTVAIFGTGSELLSVDEPLQPGKIYNSNSYMLMAQVTNAGGIPVIMETVPDDVDRAKQMIVEAMHNVDLVITTGGVSVGDYDILVDVFEQWDGEMLFNKVGMRPGSPTTVGVWKDKFLFALSGNPGACYVGFELFVRPVLWGMQGKRERYLPRFTATIAEDYNKTGTYHRFVRAKSEIKDGRVYVRPVGIDQSSVISSMRDANCLIIVPPSKEIIRAGDRVEAIQLNLSG